MVLDTDTEEFEEISVCGLDASRHDSGDNRLVCIGPIRPVRLYDIGLEDHVRDLGKTDNRYT